MMKSVWSDCRRWRWWSSNEWNGVRRCMGVCLLSITTGTSHVPFLPRIVTVAGDCSIHESLVKWMLRPLRLWCIERFKARKRLSRSFSITSMHVLGTKMEINMHLIDIRTCLVFKYKLPRKSNFFVTYFLPHPKNKLMSPMLSSSHQVKSFTNLSRTLRITRQVQSLIVSKATKQDSHCGAISSNE